MYNFISRSFSGGQPLTIKSLKFVLGSISKASAVVKILLGVGSGSFRIISSFFFGSIGAFETLDLLSGIVVTNLGGSCDGAEVGGSFDGA